ncbi:MAG: DUF1996 domain-containing protein [Microthrixaceae bacterium]
MTHTGRRIAATVAAALVVAATACSSEGAARDDTSTTPTAAAAAADAAAADASAEHAGHAASGPPGAGPLAPARHTGPQGGFGQFVTECGYSHSAPDDPIVHPGRPGYSHEHDFFGNVTTDASSTTESLLDGGTTCQKRRDTAAYWAPQLLDHGVPVTPLRSVAYYRAAPQVDPTQLEAFPAGLMVVAGDMTATEPLSPDLAGWTCGVSSRHDAAPPECPRDATLHAVVTFPDCWDGRRTDSEDHRSHMANSDAGECPPSHPVHVPQLTFSIGYPIWGPGHDLTLASGSTYGIHSDFFNAWDQDALEHEIEVCLHRDAVCGLGSNRDEEALFGHG